MAELRQSAFILVHGIHVVERARIGLFEKLRVRVDEEFPWAVPAGGDLRGNPFSRAWLVDRAQRLGQAVVTGPEGGGVEAGVACKEQSVERLRVEEGQVAGDHQPRD